MRGLEILELKYCCWDQTDKKNFFGNNWMKDKSLSLPCCQIILNNSSVIISWNFSIILGGSLGVVPFHNLGGWRLLDSFFFSKKKFLDMKISNFWSNEIFLKENDRLLVQNPILINYKPFIFLSTCLNLKLGFIEIWWSLKR